MGREENKSRLIEERYERVLQGSDQGFWEWDLARNEFSASARFETMLGYEPGEMRLSPDNWPSYVHPDDLARAWDSIQRHLKGETPMHEVEMRCRTKQGGWKWILTRGRVVERDADGRPLIMAGIHADITERKRMRERERRLKNIYHALSETNDAILRQLAPEILFATVCRIAVECGEMVLAWVGVPDAVAETIIPAARCGEAAAYVDGLVVAISADRVEGTGPVSVAYRECRPVVINDAEDNAMLAPWRQRFERYGIGSAAAFPIQCNAKPHAVLAVYSAQAGAFDDEIVRLLMRLAENVGFALDSAEREKARRKAEEALEEKEQLLNLFVENTPAAVAMFDRDMRYIAVSKRFLEDYHIAEKDIIGRSHYDVFPDIPERWKAFHRRGLAGETVRMEEDPFVRADGSVDWTRWEIRPWYSGGEIGGIVLFTEVITERKRAEEALRLAALIYRDSSEAMMVTDEGGFIVSVNQAFERITGFDAGEALGRKGNALLDGTYSEEFYQSLDETIQREGGWKGELWCKRKNGEAFAAHFSINTSFQPDGSVDKRVILFSDITARKESDERIWQQANYDNLTGLPNRNLFREHLKREIRNSRRNGMPTALLFLDLDGFKDVNDTLGHDMGDLLLKEAAERLRNCVRDADTVARLGGDEFTVILTDMQEENNADRVARHILKTLSEPFRLGDEVAYVSASIGITFYPDDADGLEDLLKNADQAMYAAKMSGKNLYRYFTASMQEAAQARMRLVNDLRGALANNQIEVAYQPIVELPTGTIRKAEALLRWNHPRLGMVNPIDFIAAAEETGMISALGNWVFREAARQAAIWREKYHPEFQISINISPMQFKKEGIDYSVWFEQLKELGMSGQGIVVEITEGLLLDAGKQVTDQLLGLRDAGIEVALDDFGTGYSSLSYLKKFDIDYIKIDQSFVRNLTADSDDLALCEAITVMAHKLDIKVIAEGIETEHQCTLLDSVGCDYGQGYLFSKPVSAQGLEDLFNASPTTFA